jgi:prolyl-tRNA synthetase
MKFTQTLIPTVKEVPADAEIPSHQLMLRAGMMRKIASGTYAYLPAGWKILMKITSIVREEMNKAGALELLMPAVQPLELWKKTGRDADYGPTMARFTDRHGRENVLAPTAEEVITHLAAGEINSYKQLPLNLYQISFKFRDEFRPRFGVLRSREFIMKDAYSFHATEEFLDSTYWKMYNAYERIFQRCGLEYLVVEAETGEMGGSGSHQFTVPCDNGEDVIVHTADNARAWNIEKAPVDPLAKPEPLKGQPTVKEVHTPDTGTIEEVCRFLKIKSDELIKTLIYSVDNDRTVAILVRGDHEANPEKINQLFPGSHVELADAETITKVTGAQVGFAGAIDLAQKVDQMIIDHAVAVMNVAVTGANKTDCHLKGVVPARDFPITGKNIKVADVRNAVEGDTFNGKQLHFRRGIEVGQVFKLGKKYSARLGCKFLDSDGTEKPCLMGCYGIGINRILASAIETAHDENGPILPVSIAPWQVIITPAGQSEQITAAAEKIYNQLMEMGIEVLLDDRDERAGVKFNDADLLGIPLRVTIGKKSIEQQKAELKLRTGSDITPVPIDQAAKEVKTLIDEMKQKLTPQK